MTQLKVMQFEVCMKNKCVVGGKNMEKRRNTPIPRLSSRGGSKN